MVFSLSEEERVRLIKDIPSMKKEYEGKMAPMERLTPRKPVTFISVGGGELGDLAVTAGKRLYGGEGGGLRMVAFDKYMGFPAQDAADASEVFNMMDGDLLEEKIRKHVPDPSAPHAIYLEVERIDTHRAYKLGMEKGYKIMSTPYGPLVCMDRHATKIMFDRLDLERADWAYANNGGEVQKIAKDFGLPVIVKPVMTSSGHGTSIVKNAEELGKAYAHSVEHARGVGNEVIVERYLPGLKTMGTEITQIVVRHFNEGGKIVNSFLPPIEHRRPGATYHESWLPASISEAAALKCKEGAEKIGTFMGGIGVYAVEQFVLGDRVYNNEVANRPHDTGLVTRWMLNMDEGGIQLTSTLGLQINPFHLEISRLGVHGVAHVVLAPEKAEGKVKGIDWGSMNGFQTKGVRGDFWYFGKPDAYPGRRMGLAIAFQRDLELARRNSEIIAHFAEECITYGGR
jgi:phosphoribosylglycinamide formyltransferase 2